jgi:DNA-binding CsgD family transcriptional regulator
MPPARTRRPPRSSDTDPVALSHEERRWLSEHRSARRALDDSVSQVAGVDSGRPWQRIAATLPQAVSVDSVALRLRDVDAGGRLHLVAAEGVPGRDLRRLALQPLTIGYARSILALGAHHSVARALGLRWLGGVWIQGEREPLGVLLLGSRTHRRPARDDENLLTEIAARLATALDNADRSARTLKSISWALARDALLGEPEPPQESPLHALRPRERAILELYTDGLSAGDIADLLVISPHTVRTHVKLAFRRLGVHSREQAARLVRADDVLGLL